MCLAARRAGDASAHQTPPHALQGQEEIGSPNLAPFLRKHKHGLLSGIDLALSADGGQISETQPCIPTGFR